MNKILIIGQALPAVKQDHPYDTTMLYDWLKEVGVTKELAQTIFSFEAVFHEFPGFNEHGGHLKPTLDQMNAHWDAVLEDKIQMADKVWVLGNVARDFIKNKPKTWSCSMRWLYTIHPSRRNWSLYQKTKHELLTELGTFLNS